MIDLDNLFSIESLKNDLKEATNDEFNHILDITGGKISNLTISLSTKMRAFPNHNFPVSEYSSYEDPTWILEYPVGQNPISITFYEDNAKYNGLKRALLYHAIPDFCVFSAIKSYATTKSYSGMLNIFISYVFKHNHLSPCNRSDIDCITPALLNEALDRAKNYKDSAVHYPSLFRIIRFWLSLSSQGAIPEEYRVNIDYTSVDNKNRHKDVIKHFQGTISSWLPFSEDELAKLMDYSLFWLEKALPELIKVRDYISGLNLTKTKGLPLVSKEKDGEFEKLTNISIDGITIMSSSISCRKTSWTVSNLSYTYLNYLHSWKNQYAIALDHIRNSLFIFVGLLIGMRAREIGQIMLDDIYKDNNEEYWINITRFKTTEDPNYQGETETMPLPYFIGACVDSFKCLKDLSDFNKQGYLFQSNKSRKVLKNFTSGQIRQIIDEIKENTGLERVHNHRFRKTVAEMLIRRSEKNIDLIRMLFGHESYSMTLKYIARNPFMVQSVAEALEANFTKDFHEVIRSIRDESYSGKPAERIAQAMIKMPEKFVGKQLRLQIVNYVAHILSSGEMYFINRSAMGTYCIHSGNIKIDNLPLCLSGKKNLGLALTPDISNCQLECEYCVVVEKARKAISDNINFYNSVLESTDNISKKSEEMIRNRLITNEKHLAALNTNHHKVRKALKIKAVQI